MVGLRPEPRSTCVCWLQRTCVCFSFLLLLPLPIIVIIIISGGRTTTLWGRCQGGEATDGPRRAGSQRGLAPSQLHSLCCGRRWPSPGASRCHPADPCEASAVSAGSAGSAGTWPGHCPGFPRQPPAQKQSARRCLERGQRVAEERGMEVRPRHGRAVTGSVGGGRTRAKRCCVKS